MKLFLKRWAIVFGVSVPVTIVSIVLISVYYTRHPYGDSLSVLGNITTAFPIVHYISIFALSTWICKCNMKQAVLVAITSPISVMVHGMLILRVAIALGI